jgi:hypothetical protein
VEPLAVLGIVGLIGVGVVTQVPKLWRRPCPQCQRRSLSDFGRRYTVTAAGEREWYRHTYCVRCKLHLASIARDEYIALTEWNRGVRTATPWARVLR